MNIPPNTRIQARTNLSEIGSETNITPPIAAITGTDNWTTAACVEDNPLRARYHIVYPNADAKAPDITASIIPLLESSSVDIENRHSINTKGMVYVKLDAVSIRGVVDCLPNNVYPPHAMPETSINTKPDAVGVVNVGYTK